MEYLCPNCESHVSATAVYCPVCGQKTRLPRLAIREVAQEAVQSLTNVDKGLFTLLRQLVMEPGVTAREYIGGKRRKHFPPLSFFLLVSTIMIVILSFSSGKTGNGSATHPDVARIQDPHKREHVQKIYERRNRSTLFLSTYSDIIAMVAVPLIAVIFWLVYKKRGYNYTEHLIACMYMISFMNLVWALFFIPMTSLFKTGHTGSGMIIEGVHKALEVIYFSIFYKNFASQNGNGSLLRSTLSSVLVIVVWTFLTMLLITGYITNGFFGILE
jgi:hypothetical protein